jgi:IPT/TIG domain
VNDGSLKVSLPGGTPGRRPSIVLSRAGFSSAPVASVSYGAAVTSAAPVLDAKGTLLRLTGRGFAKSGSWTLTSDTDATKVTNLPVSTESGEVGVVVQSDTNAAVRLPAAPGAVGSYRLAFTPDQVTYPGAGFADTPAAHYGYKLPTITAISATKASTLGGTRIVLKGTGLLAVDPASAQAVTVRPVADGSRTAAATVSERTDTSLTLVLPAAVPSAGAGSAPLEGSYRIVVSTPLGTATAATKTDLVTYVKPFVGAVVAGTKAPATGGPVRLAGSGFGSTLADFGVARLTATVNGRTTSVTWVSDTTVSVILPAGVPGATASIALLRDGVPGPSVDVPYVAVVTGLSATTGPTSGGTVVAVTGKGFAGSSVWKILAMDGSTVATLSRVSSLDGTSSGVVVLSDTKAVVKMPPASAFGAVYLAVTPDQGLYPGAGYAPTSKSVFVYSDLG